MGCGIILLAAIRKKALRLVQLTKAVALHQDAGGLTAQLLGGSTVTIHDGRLQFLHGGHPDPGGPAGGLPGGAHLVPGQLSGALQPEPGSAVILDGRGIVWYDSL